MIIDISEDGRTIEWWSNGERKIATIYQLIDVYDGIVRCKDCKHNGTWLCMVNQQADEIMPMDDEDYCSWGKRKNEVKNETT